MGSLLQKLEDNRNAILLAEIGVRLHLLGKLSEEFIQSQSQQSVSFGYRQICNNNPLGLDNIFFQIISDNWVQTIFDSLNSAIPNVPQPNRSPNSLCEFMRYHLKREINNFQDCALLKIVTAAHDISGAEEKDLPWVQKDSKQKIKQPDKSRTYAATAFGFEEYPIITNVNLKNVRDSLVSNLYPILDTIKNNSLTLNETWWRQNYHIVLSEFEKAYRVTVGDTQRPVNDVTLWDATSLSSTLFKSALAKMILEGWTEPIDLQNTKKPAIVNWKILRINLDTLSIMARGVKIGDILGYQKAIKDSLSVCKKIIEVKYCLGNEIYHDETGIYFSFPDVDVTTLGFWNDLINELIEAVHKIEPELSPAIELSNSIPDFKDLTSQRVSAVKNIVFSHRNKGLSQDFSNLWSNAPRNSEICPICRLRPMKENSDGCEHCLKRRKGRAENWIIKDPRHTIWLDEVSDHNDRVALLLCSFSLMDWLNGKLIPTMVKKTPSSGRVRRCWETTYEFIESTVFAGVLSNFTYGKNFLNLELRNKRIQFKLDPNPQIAEGATCDVDLKGIRLSPVCIDKNNGTFISTINLQILEKWGNTVEKIASNMQVEVMIKTTELGWQKGFISDANPADEKFHDYLPYVQIYDSPDQFMAIVPAYDALEIAKKIVEEYEVQFSKVRDRLPLHIGIIASHRKTPLYVAMDAGERLIDVFKKSKEINARVDSPPQEIDTNKDTAYKKFGHKVEKLKLVADPCYSNVPLEWIVSYGTGDPTKPDEWHPYLRFNGGNPNRGNYSFDYDGKGNYVVHVKELRHNDCIKIEGPYFKLAYLENAAERFKVDDGLRPLDDIKRLDELWNDVAYILKSKNLGFSQIYTFWQEVKKRYEDYKGDSVWENFVKSSLVNILRLSPKNDKESFDKLFHATKDGLLDLCLHWNLQVRKIKFEK